jgi:hypothetical protein
METGAMTVCSQCSQVLGRNFDCTMCVKHYEQPTVTGKRLSQANNKFPSHVIALVARGTILAERQEQGRHAAATHAAATLAATAGIPQKRVANVAAAIPDKKAGNAAKSIPAQIAQRIRDKQGESDKAAQVQEAGEDLFSLDQDDSAQFGALLQDRPLPISAIDRQVDACTSYFFLFLDLLDHE